jgi:hypothetical protein
MASRTNIVPPPILKNKGTPPSIEEASNNLQSHMPGELVSLNFRVPIEFRKQVRQCALDSNISAVQLVTIALEAYMKKS